MLKMAKGGVVWVDDCRTEAQRRHVEAEEVKRPRIRRRSLRSKVLLVGGGTAIVIVVGRL